MAIVDSPQFGSVLASGASSRRVWWVVVPGILAIGALVVAAGAALSRASGLETQVRLARDEAAEARKAVEQRDKLLLAARVDEDLLRSAGRGAAVLAAPSPQSPASGVALYHPARRALKVYAFGLVPPPAGQEYRVEAIAGDQRTAIGAIAPDERGSAFLLARDVPEAATGIAVRLAPAGAQAEGPPVLAGTLPRAGESGVVAAEPPPVQARSPAAARGRRR